MEARNVFRVVLLCVGFLQVYSFSTGAPDGACQDLIPQHHTEPQNGNFPYKIKTNVLKISPSGQVKVTISGDNGTKFKGFMIQARIGDVPYGSFEAANGMKLVNCNRGKANTATHSDPSEKSSITLIWNAPAKLTGNVIFTATVAKDGGTFWVAQKAAPVTIA